MPLALIIVFEEWGWRPLAAALARLSRLRSIAMLEAEIAALQPYGALVVFVLPSVLILPLKLLALWLIAGGHIVSASVLFIGAKIVGTAIVARRCQLTQPALMQLKWFAWAYNVIMPWKDALLERVRASWAWQAGRRVKAGLKRRFSIAWRAWRPLLSPLIEGARKLVTWASFRARP